MRRQSSWALGILLALAADQAPAQGSWDAATMQTATAIRDQALHDDTAWSIVQSLSNEVGPRMAGSANDAKAVAWAKKMLVAQGFKNVHAESVTVGHWVRGSIGVRIVGDHQDLAAVALGGSAGTPAAGITAEVVMTENLESLRQIPIDQLKGRIVYFDQHMQAEKDGSGYGRAISVRAQGAAEAGRRGAVGIAIRTVGTAHDHFPHTGAQRTDSLVKPIPAVALGDLDADQLAARLRAGEPVKLHLQLGSKDLGTAPSANVIGEIPGETDELVVLGAHLDSWDLARGSNDDGAGVAIVTGAARMVGKVAHRPHRTLRVILFASEETGAKGALRYAVDHANEMPRHVAAVEADFGSAPVWRLGGAVPEAAWPMVTDLAAFLAPLGVEPGSNGADGGTDIGPQRAAGVPTFAPLQDGTHYFDIHHSAKDTLENIDQQGLKQNVAVYASIAYLAAQYGPGLGRLPVQAP